LQRKVESLASLGETDEMALAGILSTQLLHQLFIADFRRPSAAHVQESAKVIQRGEPAVAAPQAL
jgi:hypothetical protein